MWRALLGGGFALALCVCGGLTLRLHAVTAERENARHAAAAWETIAAARENALAALNARAERTNAALAERERTLAALRADTESEQQALKEALIHDKATADWAGGTVPAVLDGVFRAAGGVRAGGH